MSRYSILSKKIVGLKHKKAMSIKMALCYEEFPKINNNHFFFDEFLLILYSVLI